MKAATVDRTGLQRALDEIVAAGPAGALAEVRDEHGTWRGASGVAELDTSRPVPARGRFRAGSITKTFVATVVLQLVAEHRLRLEDTVEQCLPGALPTGDRITVRHLLSHTSGLYNYTDTLLRDPATIVDNRWRTWSPQELLSLAAGEPLAFDPGKGWKYSSTNYILLGMVVQMATGRPYRDEVYRRIIRPLGLRHTSLPGTSPVIRGRHAHGYLPISVGGTARLVDMTAMNPSAAWAAGELISNAADLNRFYATLLGGHLLLPDELRLMTTPVRSEDWGLGLRRWDLACGVTAYGQTGDAIGYSTWSFVTADTRRCVTFSITWGTKRPTGAAGRALVERVLCAAEMTGAGPR